MDGVGRPDVSAAGAVEMLRSAEISQLPVLERGRSVGSIQEITLARDSVRDPRGSGSHVLVGGGGASRD